MSEKTSEDDVKRKELLANSDQPQSNQDRRTFLKASGWLTTALAFIPGLSRVSSAANQRPTREEVRDAANEYRSSEKVREALESEGKEVLEALAERGLLASSSVDNLEIEEVLNPRESFEQKESTVVIGVDQGGKSTALIRIKREFEEYELQIMVQPHVKRSYAVIKPKNEFSEGIMVHTDGSDVETEDFCQTEEKPCYTDSDGDNECLFVEYECCQSGRCSILGFNGYSSCVAPPEGCTTVPRCPDICS